ncbi:hypothetical protein CGRA01v4_09066 [Colletotrichum graminicola]|nr:hypothetical protein CGRA01v4_09066 [Colletotrichum graminicola]
MSGLAEGSRQECWQWHLASWDSKRLVGWATLSLGKTHSFIHFLLLVGMR